MANFQKAIQQISADFEISTWQNWPYFSWSSSEDFYSVPTELECQYRKRMPQMIPDQTAEPRNDIFG